jgi:hypothetical protein
MLFPWAVVALLAELPAVAGAAEDDPGAGDATAGAADVRLTLLT